MAHQRNWSTLILLIIAGEAVFLLPFVLPRIFRHVLLEVYEITNLEMGTAFSAYGIVAMLSYFFGGPLADRFPARWLISASLILTSLGGWVMSLGLSFTGWMILYGYWGFTTIFLLWAAMIRATREWGGTGDQGKAFGFLEGGRGVVSALVGLIGLTVFSNLTASFVEGDGVPIHRVIQVVSMIVALVGVSVAIWLPSKLGEGSTLRDQIQWKEVLGLLSDPRILLQGAIIVCAYVGYKMTDDLSLFAKEVLDMTDVRAASVGSAALWLRPVFAITAGLLADRIGGLRTIQLAFLTTVIGGALMASGWLDELTVWALSTMVFTVMGIYALRGVYFAIMNETEVPKAATGTAVGIMSVIGYTPDVFASPLMGYLLDTFNGAQGHHMVFATMAIAAAIGFGSAALLTRHA